MAPFVKLYPMRPIDAMLLPFRKTRDFWLWLGSDKGQVFGWILAALGFAILLGMGIYNIWN